MRPWAEITEHATQALVRELGVVDTIRFLNQFTNGVGDYTQERKDFLRGVTLDEIVSEMHGNSESAGST